MLPDIDAIRTMLPWILFATMSFATALAVMKDPEDDVSILTSSQVDKTEPRHTNSVHPQHPLKVRHRVL